jgi:hypothetical protein
MDAANQESNAEGTAMSDAQLLQIVKRERERQEVVWKLAVEAGGVWDRVLGRWVAVEQTPKG